MPAVMEQIGRMTIKERMTLINWIIEGIRAGRIENASEDTNPLTDFVGCIRNGRRTDEVVGEFRGYNQW